MCVFILVYKYYIIYIKSEGGGGNRGEREIFENLKIYIMYVYMV